MPKIPAIELDRATFAYDETRPVLSGASLSIAEGEMVALVGCNGSGKSTIAKLACAALLPQSGSVRIFGRDTREVEADGGVDGILALRRGIGLVFQNPDDQIVASIVTDEVAFGPSNLGLPRDEVVERVEDALEAVGMLDFVGRNVNALSGGQRQRLALADALAMRPRFLILDEPASMLDSDGRRALLGIVERLHGRDTAILLITHSAEHASLADRVIAVKEGRIVEGSDVPRDALEAPAARLMASCVPHLRQFSYSGASSSSAVRNESHSPRNDDAVSPCSLKKPREHGGTATETAIRFRDASFSYSGKGRSGLGLFDAPGEDIPVFEHVDMEVRTGELLVVSGANGSGKTTLLQHMNGLLKPTSGTVEVFGESTSSRKGANAARHSVGLCLQYPERSLFAQSVYDDVAYGPRNLGLDENEVDERVRKAMADMELPFGKFSDRNPFDLSGGEQRKVALAGMLALRPRVLAMDEPCASLDNETHAHILRLLLMMKGSGQTIVLVTHDEDDVALLADRVYRMS